MSIEAAAIGRILDAHLVDCEFHGLAWYEECETCEWWAPVHAALIALWRRLTDGDDFYGDAPSLPGEQPGGEPRKPLVRARYPLTPGQANVSLEDDDDFPALPGERADEEPS